MFCFSSPPAGVSASAGSSSSGVSLGETGGALAYGRSALLRLGGKVKEVTAAGEGSGIDFDMDLIKIPEGVTPQNLKQFTLYQMLGFSGDIGDSADVEVIKKAYHKAVLMYHPDKAQFKDTNGNEDRTVFLKIQQAFDVLCSEPKRRAYDSQLPFDDAVPTEEITNKYLAKGDHKFFKLFGPVFKRNARFSVKKPVPEVGDLESPIEQVYAFYQFWINFESWRDFTGVGAEHKPDDAGSRYEKRHMEKENAKLAEKMKKKEMNRIIDFVQLAEKRDPRLVKDKADKKAAKEAAKDAKLNAAKKNENAEKDALAWIDAEEEAFKESWVASKADREKTKKKLSAGRNLLKKLLRTAAKLGHGDQGEFGFLTAADVDVIGATANMDDLTAMTEGCGGAAAEKDNSLFSAAGVDTIKAKLNELAIRNEELVDDERIAKDARKREAEEKAMRGKKPQEREWESVNDDALMMALNRYAVGHATRWESIANLLTDKLAPELGNSYAVLETKIRAFELSQQ